MHIDPSAISHQDAYKILIGSVLPRPIAWVTSLSPTGVVNLAPFSFFNVVCANPPIISFAPMRRGDGTTKDTLNNVTATGEFVVNIVSEANAEAVNASSKQFPPDESELTATGLTPLPSQVVAPPRVGESLIQFECRVHDIVTVSTEPLGGSLVLGRIVAMHLDDSVYQNGRVSADVLKPIGRCAGQTFCRVTDTFELIRPDATYIGR